MKASIEMELQVTQIDVTYQRLRARSEFLISLSSSSTSAFVCLVNVIPKEAHSGYETRLQGPTQRPCTYGLVK